MCIADDMLSPSPSGMEDLREKGELQRAYYGFLHSITSSTLASVLLQTPSQSLHLALGAVVAGGAGHVDPGTRKTCLQVWKHAKEQCKLSESVHEHAYKPNTICNHVLEIVAHRQKVNLLQCRPPTHPRCWQFRTHSPSHRTIS